MGNDYNSFNTPQNLREMLISVSKYPNTIGKWSFRVRNTHLLAGNAHFSFEIPKYRQEMTILILKYLNNVKI